MPQTQFRRNSRAALLAVIAAAYPVMGHSAPAARVDFAIGNVTAVTASGQSRALAKGAQLDEGETINTNNGRAQLRFTDGAYVSLQPESQFRIDQYRFEGKVDGSEKGLFSLLKGGLRTITGLVGRNNKKNYQISTTVATIGIRGTEYTIQYGQSITGTVGEGEIEVCNGAGCLSVTDGESYYVQNQDLRPVLTNKRTDLPPPEPPPPPAQFVQGDDKKIPRFALTGTQSFALTGTQTLNTVTGEFFCDGTCVDPHPGITVVFDSSGSLVSFDSVVPTSVQMGGNDGIMAWGAFVDSSRFSGLTHFVAGIPVPASDLAALGGTTATYDLIPHIGATPVRNSSGDQIGTLDVAKLVVGFGASISASANMDWTIQGASLSALLSLSGSGSTISMTGSCGGSCSVVADVALFGPNATRAGMVYNIKDFLNNLEGVGAAALSKR